MDTNANNAAYIADIIFTGHVQGVGFRFKCFRLAAGFEVSGFVQNLPDGSVRLSAAGEKNEVQAFVAEVKKSLSPFIRNADESDSFGENPYKSFDIR